MLTLNSIFEHQISGRSQPIPPRISAGGILADEMGLGKTLTILSAVVHSLDEANHFTMPSGQTSVDDHLACPTKATLVVVPSARKCTFVSDHSDSGR
jgi:SWI/SNF-related matrix-associated actin-dependent regulator of chromatin subfamily A3